MEQTSDEELVARVGYGVVGLIDAGIPAVQVEMLNTRSYMSPWEQISTGWEIDQRSNLLIPRQETLTESSYNKQAEITIKEYTASIGPNPLASGQN